MDSEWQQHVDGWNAARARAIEDGICFCVHGCDQKATFWYIKFTSEPMPGLCDGCAKARKKVRGRQQHELMRGPAENFHSEVEEALPEPRVSLGSRLRRLAEPNRRAEAEEYARSYGEDGPGFRFMQAMCTRVRTGQQLTERQIATVLRSKDAEVKGATSALGKLMARTDKMQMADRALGRLSLSGVPTGSYAVRADGEVVTIRVERPTKGVLMGYTVVTMVLGEEATRYGMQQPPPWRDADKFPSYYMGRGAPLVASLIRNPTEARQLFEQTRGMAA